MKVKSLQVNVFLLSAFIFALFSLPAVYGASKNRVVIASEIVKPALRDIPVATPQPVEEVSPSKEQQYQEFAKYVKTIFGKDAEVALAVSAVECNKANKAWPGCVYSTEKEHSVGTFQINVSKEHGKGAWVHWSKIPGKDLAEKEEWLKNEHNNTLVAFKIYTDAGNTFSPWSGYTSGAYLKFVK